MKIKAKTENIGAGVRYAEEELKKWGIADRKIRQSLLTLEEVLSAAVNGSGEDTEISILVENIRGNIRIRVQYAGEPLEKSRIREQMSFTEDLLPEERIVVDNLFDRVIGSQLSIRSSRGFNRCLIQAGQKKRNSLRIVFASMILGLVVGFGLKLCLPELAPWISENLFTPVYTMFLNALKMIVGPLVLVSIANSVMGFDDLKTLGRIASRVFVLYILTSAIAIGIGMLTYRLFPIGNTELSGAVTDAAASKIAAGSSVSLSIKDIIVGIIPSDIIRPFLNTEMLQILFMGTLLGAAVAVAGKDTVFARFLTDANHIMLKITEMIMVFLPLSNFCAMAKLVISLDRNNLLDLAAWVPVIGVGQGFMLLVYAILILLFVRMNPLSFFKKISKAMTTALATSSSNATMPVTMECCGRNLKISQKVYAFSIPFGATVNMDGSCITLIITTLFMAKSFGITVTGGMLISLFISILALSMGSPGVPGGSLVAMTLLFPMIGVPAEAVSIIMGLYISINGLQTMVNVTGDTVVTAIVARSEKLMDTDP